MFANLDGVIHENGETVIFEAKTVSAYKQGIWENGIPDEYMLRVQHYMAVTGAKKTYIAALAGGNRFYYHQVPRDELLILKIISMGQYFWEYHVMNGVEPVPDGSEATTAYLNEIFAVSNGKSIELPEEVLPACEKYEQLSKQLKELEREKNVAGNQIKSYMKDFEVGLAGSRKVVWKPVTKNTLDTARLKAEQPEIYEAYLSETKYRKLSVA